jgi:hypothetical protein
MNITKRLLALVTVAAMTGCVYVKKDVVQAPCNLPATVSYATNIVPILQTNCYGCHSNASNLTGILLDNYNTLKSYASSGTLYGVISHSAGFRAMPDGGSKLDDCTISTIKKWIDAGAPNN